MLVEGIDLGGPHKLTYVMEPWTAPRLHAGGGKEDGPPPVEPLPKQDDDATEPIPVKRDRMG